MDINEQVLDNILYNGEAPSMDNNSIFDEINAQEIKMSENGDLYDAYYKINKVLEGPSRYNEIQGLDSAIDVNTGIVKIFGTCKHMVKAQAEDLNQADDAVIDNQYTDNIIATYAEDLAKVIPDNLKLDWAILDDTLPHMDKRQFEIIISRKG